MADRPLSDPGPSDPAPSDPVKPGPASAGGPIWVPTRALGRAVVLCGLLVLLGVVFGRLDLVVLATPFALGTAWALRRRPVLAPVVTVRLPEATAEEGGPVRVMVELANPDRSAAVDLAVLRLIHSPWLRLAHADRPYATRVGAGEMAQVELSGDALRWGRPEVGPALAYGVAGDGLLLTDVRGAAGSVLPVHPRMPVFRATDTMPRATALAGTHRSRRPGEGGELAGVRRYGPGDRLRRVDWRVTLRTGEPHVVQTLSDRDAEVLLLLDLVQDAGPSGGIHGAASVMDTTVRAAAAITEYYLRQGDRVGLLDYSVHPRYLPAAGGRRQLIVALEWLLSTRPGRGGPPPRFAVEWHLIPVSALVVVLTPMLSPHGTELIAALARAGRAVIAVDTLGDLANSPVPRHAWTAVAQAVWRMERDNTIGALREVGVPVTGWVGAGSLDDVLRDMSRLARAPRVVVR
jgi:uncharacterized protein (DUF58 family)